MRALDLPATHDDVSLIVKAEEKKVGELEEAGKHSVEKTQNAQGMLMVFCASVAFSAGSSMVWELERFLRIHVRANKRVRQVIEV